MDKQEIIDLVSKAQGGDNNAFEKLFVDIQDNLYFYALKMIHNQQDAEDAVQSTAIEIFKSIGKLQNPEFFKTWAVRICHNVCCKQFKKNGLSTISVDDDESFIDDIADEDKESMPAELAESEEFKNIIEQMVDSLSDMQRSCLLLYYFEELDINEISEMLEIPTGTVKSNLNYARKKLKACVNDYEEKNNIKLHSVGVLPLLWLLNKNVHVTFPVFKGASTMTTTVETAKSTVETIGHLGKLKSFLCTTAGKIIAVTTAAAIVVTGVVVNKISSEDDKAIVIVENNSEATDNSQTQTEDLNSSEETKTAVFDSITTITNSEYCDMKYTLSIPNWEFEKDRGVLDEENWTRNYTRMYKSDDEKFKFFVTEYFGKEKYPGQIDDQFGASLHTEADAISGSIVDEAIYDLTGYTDNMQILSKEPIKGINGESYYEFCLQCPNEYDNYYYAKGYVAVGIKRPIAVYFFDKTKETIYDEDMINKSLEIIKTLNVDKEYMHNQSYDDDDSEFDIEY